MLPLWVENRETAILHLVLDLLDAEPVSQRCVDLECLPTDTFLLLRRQRVDGPEVVQPVGQLDEQHTDVLGHGDDHLPNGGCLCFFPGSEADAIQFGDTVDHPGDFWTEGCFDLLESDIGIFDGVVQESRCQGVCIQSVVGQDLRYGQRMADVWLPRLAELAKMHLLAEGVGLVDRSARERSDSAIGRQPGWARARPRLRRRVGSSAQPPS